MATTTRKTTARAGTRGSANASTGCACDNPGQLADLERRLEAVERTLALMMQTRTGHDIQQLKLCKEAHAIEAANERKRKEARIAAAPDRAETFKRFADSRLALHPNLSTSAAALLVAHLEWCVAEQIPALHRCATLPELADAVAAVLPDAQAGEIPNPKQLGTPVSLVPGYAGIGLVPNGETSADVVQKLDDVAAGDDRDRDERRAEVRDRHAVDDAILRRRITRDEAARLTVEQARGRHE